MSIVLSTDKTFCAGLKHADGKAIAWVFVTMFENMTKACCTWFALFGNSQGEANIVTKTTQNYARTANVFACQSKMCILNSF